MLIQFKFGNHLSFKEERVFSMVGVPSFPEHRETHVFSPNENYDLLTSAALFGANASGKSNFVDAFSMLKNQVSNSFRDALSSENGGQIDVKQFKLNTATEYAPSTFEIVFLLNDTVYRYGFSIDRDKVVDEYLFYTKERETPLFERKLQNITINKTSFKEGQGLEKRVRENVLFLTLIAQFNGDISNTIIQWFRNLNVISGLQDLSYRTYTVSRLKEDPKFKQWVDEFVRFLEIEQVTTEEIEISLAGTDKIPPDLESFLIDPSSTFQKGKITRLLTWHRKYDENNFLVDTVPFSLQKNESEGTKKFIYLLGPWYDTIVNGKILVIDELDSRLHTHLTRKLLDFFNQNNEHNAQVIFALHDTNLLDPTLFRRDQIWFVEKDQYGASDLYSLADYNSVQVRSNSNFEKHYIEGKYGAIPYFGDMEKLTELLHGEKVKA
ncbi:MAG: ATP-binding protein [Bacteroidia bacterium]